MKVFSARLRARFKDATPAQAVAQVALAVGQQLNMLTFFASPRMVEVVIVERAASVDELEHLLIRADRLAKVLTLLAVDCELEGGVVT